MMRIYTMAAILRKTVYTASFASLFEVRLLHIAMFVRCVYKSRTLAMIPAKPGMRQSGLGAFLMHARTIMQTHTNVKVNVIALSRTDVLENMFAKEDRLVKPVM